MIDDTEAPAANLHAGPTRCLLVHPKFSRHSFWNYGDVCRLVGARYPAAPLGMLTVAALLPRHWELKLVDENCTRLRDGDLDWADLVLTGGMLPQQRAILNLIEHVHAHGKAAVVGGPDPTSQPEKYAAADFAVLGEGEVTVPLWLEDLRHGARRGVYAAEAKADMARAAVPRYDLINFGHYLHMGIQFSRGCPYDCEFCDVIELFGRVPRTKTPAHILAELGRLYDLGYRGHVDFVDDNLIGNRKYAAEVLEAVREWQRTFGYPFYFSTEASLNLARDEQLLELMRDCDFRYVFIGIESPEAAVCDKSAKKLAANATIADAVRTIGSYGMVVNAGFIMGFDNESARTAADIVACIEDTGICMAMVGTLYALPNTRLTRRLREEGRLLEEGSTIRDVETDVDNTTAGLNFITARPREAILRDYVSVLSSIYRPRNYYRRVRQTGQLLRAQGRHKPSFWANVKAGWAFVKLSFHATVRPRLAPYYWRTILNLLKLKPQGLVATVNLAAMFIHFHKQSRFIIANVSRRFVPAPAA